MRKNKKEIRNQTEALEEFKTSIQAAMQVFYKRIRYPHLKK